MLRMRGSGDLDHQRQRVCEGGRRYHHSEVLWREHHSGSAENPCLCTATSILPVSKAVQLTRSDVEMIAIHAKRQRGCG